LPTSASPRTTPAKTPALHPDAARKLGLSDRIHQPGYEDTWYYLWRERRLPVNVDPFESKLDDEMERIRLRRVFDQGLDAVVGYVLPLQAQPAGRPRPGRQPLWSTGPWFFRDERMYLTPAIRRWATACRWIPALGQQGRLPLPDRAGPLRAARRAAPRPRCAPSTPPCAAAAAEGGTVALRPGATGRRLCQAAWCTGGEGLGPVAPAGLGAAPSRLLARRSSRRSHARSAPSRHARPARRFESAHWITRTALCVEVRDPRRANGPKAEAEHGGKSGVLYVFMPPLARLEDYLDLLAAVEATAEELGVKIVLEGYPPPRDPRLKLLQVTPDPGVIEVNIHPAHNWGELVEHTEFLYQAAFETRLSAEKFMTDGRHTGTGGGNHFVMGGATPSDSPFLRKPELLASLMACTGTTTPA
jgi:uncharacterized protein (DUF2126 family)